MTQALPALVQIATLAALAAPLKWALGLIAALLIIVPLRLLGLYLIRKGGAMERAKHGIVPGTGSGTGSEPAHPAERPADTSAVQAEPARYDPFDAG